MITVLLLAQLAFVRPHMPVGREWRSMHKVPAVKEGDVVVPTSGTFTLDYQQIFPCAYDGATCRVAPMFCDHDTTETRTNAEGKKFIVHLCSGGNREPLYVKEESFKHITVAAKPGTKWHWRLDIAVPNEGKK